VSSRELLSFLLSLLKNPPVPTLERSPYLLPPVTPSILSYPRGSSVCFVTSSSFLSPSSHCHRLQFCPALTSEVFHPLQPEVFSPNGGACRLSLRRCLSSLTTFLRVSLIVSSSTPSSLVLSSGRNKKLKFAPTFNIFLTARTFFVVPRGFLSVRGTLIFSRLVLLSLIFLALLVNFFPWLFHHFLSRSWFVFITRANRRTGQTAISRLNLLISFYFEAFIEIVHCLSPTIVSDFSPSVPVRIDGSSSGPLAAMF